MKKEEIHIEDIRRILIGNAPVEFLLETLIRTLIVYFILLLFIRWLGKRMAGQLTLTEMSVMITLGAIVSPAMQLPDRGILVGVLALALITFLQRGITLLSINKPKIEELTQGKTTLLVKEGVIQLDSLDDSKITRQQLYANLREDNIYNLGRVKRMYLEACGLFSIYKQEEEKAGLPIFPPGDDEVLSTMKKANMAACENCGLTLNYSKNTNCTNCGSHNWVEATF